MDRGKTHAWLDRKLKNLVNRLDLLIWGRMKDNDDGTNQTNGAAQLAQSPELFLEDVGAQDSSYQDR